MTIPFLDLAAASREVAADQSAAIERVLASGWYVLGPEVERFEREFAATSVRRTASASRTASTRCG